MAADDRPDFDVMSLLQGPMTVMSGVMGMADSARKTVGGLVEAVTALQRAASAIEQLVTRMNRLVDDIEAPMRALAPEFEKSVARMQRLSDAFEGPLDRLVPGLESAIGTLDRLSMTQLPESLEQVREQIMGVMEGFAEIPRRFGAFADLVPGMDRLRALAAPGRPTPGPAPTAAHATTGALRAAAPAKVPAARQAGGSTRAKGTPAPAKKAAPKKAAAKRAPARRAPATRAAAPRS